jgi:hypothetical protein
VVSLFFWGVAVVKEEVAGLGAMVRTTKKKKGWELLRRIFWIPKQVRCQQQQQRSIDFYGVSENFQSVWLLSVTSAVSSGRFAIVSVDESSRLGKKARM